jgi:hypothetical protein
LAVERLQFLVDGPLASAGSRELPLLPI